MSELSRSPRCGIVPPYLLQALAEADGHAGSSAEHTLRRDVEHRAHRQGRHTGAAGPLAPVAEPGPAPGPDDGTGPQRVIDDAAGRETLPGTTVRREGQPATGDAAVDEAYDGLGQTWSLYSEVFGRDSLDGRGLALLATVHYGKDYDNAFWDGTRMVFGDGDGEVFNRFTVSVDVIGHELTHGVTELTAGLTYRGQSGALNESVSDVFGSLVRQRAAGQSADEADWLIGAGLFTDSVRGVALRSMKAPGTAYDDPRLGKDPQPATMADYVETTDDNGGVHINSGIPNHAFYLAATAIGGHAWEAAGPDLVRHPSPVTASRPTATSRPSPGSPWQPPQPGMPRGPARWARSSRPGRRWGCRWVRARTLRPAPSPGVRLLPPGPGARVTSSSRSAARVVLPGCGRPAPLPCTSCLPPTPTAWRSLLADDGFRGLAAGPTRADHPRRLHLSRGVPSGG